LHHANAALKWNEQISSFRHRVQ